MDIAVVIPLFNGEEWIRSTLESVTEQSCAPSEVIVVDDGSTDASPSIARSFSEVRLLENPGNGPASARNHGSRATEAEAIAFLDQDDLWHPDHLKTLSRALEAHPDAAGAFSRITSFRSSSTPQFAVDSGSSRLYNPWEDYPRNVLGQPVGGLLRREPYEQVDRWPTHFSGCDDYHLWLKLGVVGEFVVTSSTTAAHRIHGESYSHSLRAEEIEDYYERFVAASEDALNRRAQTKGDARTYARRLEGQQALLDLLRALRRGQGPAVRHAAERFGTSVAQESRPVILNLWNNFVWFGRPLIEEMGMDAFAVRVLGLLHHWPREADRTREIIYDWAIGRASAAELVRRHPLKIRYWSLLARRVVRKLHTSAPLA